MLAIQGEGFDITFVRRWLTEMLGPDSDETSRLEALLDRS